MTPAAPVRPQPGRQFSKSIPMCRARAMFPAWTRFTSFHPTNRRLAHRRRRFRRCVRWPTPRALSRWRFDRSARSDRLALRHRSRADHLRQRLRRTARAVGARFSAPRRRSPLQPVRLSLLTRSHSGGGGNSGRRRRRRDKTDERRRILARSSARTKIVFLANPNNPTGTYMPCSEVKRLHDGLPAHTLLVIDAAYAEYVTRNDYAAGLEMVDGGQRRDDRGHFPRSMGLPAAYRLGLWLGARHRRVEPGPRAVQRQRGGAGGGRREPRRCGAHRRRDRAQHALAALASRGVAELGIEVTPSVGNFLLLSFPEHGRTARTRTHSERARLHSSRRSRPTDCPNCCVSRSATRRRTRA